jgi:NADH-quinone oxidoreductase subunit J
MNPSLAVTATSVAPGLLTADGLTGLIFLVMMATTIIGGIIACCARRLVRAVAGLVVCFIGVAALYYFLNSPFVAMMQMLIYVGAVCITIAFAIMLAAPEESTKPGPSGPLSGPLGFITAGIVSFGMIVMAMRSKFTSAPKVNDGTVKEMGIQFLTQYSMVFELVSIVLLIAIIGALVIARAGRSK